MRVESLPSPDGRVNPKVVLGSVVQSEECDDMEEIMIIVKTKSNKEPVIWTSTRDPWFLWACSYIAGDLAVNTEIIDGDDNPRNGA